MRLLIQANGGGDVSIYMAVVDFDISHILGLMDNWPEVDNLAEMSFYGGADWREGGDMDVIDVLNGEPILEFEHVELGQETRVECERMVVSERSVYWRGRVKHTEVEVETQSMDRKYLLALRTGLEQMKESIDEHDQGHG